MRWLHCSLVALVVLLAASPAHARRGSSGGIVIINTGDDIVHIRNLQADQVQEVASTDEFGSVGTVELGALGYKYSLFGLFWLDLWRSDGEFVLYSGVDYVTLSAEEVELLGGASVPWKYHFPPGLVLIIAAIELFILSRARRRAKPVMIIGGVLIAFSGLMFIQGVELTCLIPLALGLYHVVLAWDGVRHPENEIEEVVESATETVSARPEPTPRPSRPSRPPPRIDGELAPRPSQPLVVQHPARAPSQPPIVHDPSAEAPKLLL